MPTRISEMCIGFFLTFCDYDPYCCKFFLILLVLKGFKLTFVVINRLGAFPFIMSNEFLPTNESNFFLQMRTSNEIFGVPNFNKQKIHQPVSFVFTDLQPITQYYKLNKEQHEKHLYNQSSHFGKSECLIIKVRISINNQNCGCVVLSQCITMHHFQLLKHFGQHSKQQRA